MVAEAMHTLFRLGGEQAHVDTPFVASGEHMAPPNRIPSDKIIRDGDLVFIDIGAGMVGLLERHGPHGLLRREAEPPPEGGVHRCLPRARDSEACMKAGNTNDDVARAVREVAAAYGLEDHFISLFIGHGIGMGQTNRPTSARICPAPRLWCYRRE